MSTAIDTEQCAGCAVVNHCDRWVPGGNWKHRKGVEPCRPVPENKSRTRPRITEEPIVKESGCPDKSANRDESGCYSCPKEEQCRKELSASIDAELEQERRRQEQIAKEIAMIRQNQKQTGIIDADQEQRARFSLRSLK